MKSAQTAVGSQDTLTATADKGWVFDQWTVSGLPTNSATTSPALKFTVGPNSIVTANFIPNPFAALHGVYDGLFYTPGAVASDNAGYFSLTLNSSGTFSGHLWMGAGLTTSLRSFTAPSNSRPVAERNR